jgi:hypothetical protein
VRKEERANRALSFAPPTPFGSETMLKRRFKFFSKNFVFQEEQALKSPARIFRA